MTTLNIEGKRIKVSDDFLRLSPEDQEKTVNEIAAQMKLKPSGRYPVMSQVNRGIADAAGGFIDALNPFDEPHSLNPFPNGTGSARDAMITGMEGLGIEVATGDPETVAQGFARGFGEAAGSAGYVTKGAQMLSKAGGVVGSLADDAFRALASVGGLTAEVVAGGASGASRQLAKDAGAPEWGQDLAAIAGGGIALPVATGVPRYAPSAVGGRKVAAAVKRAVMPYTEAGGQEVARKRLQSLAGGEERAGDLARQINPADEFGLTPAQQTGDPNMLGLERLATDQDSALAARLAQRNRESQQAGKEAISDLGGDVADAREFFARRRADFADELNRQANKALDNADADLARTGANRSEAENSLIVRRKVDLALEDALMQEKSLWDAVPRGAQVGTSNTKATVARISESLPYAQRADLPRSAGEVLTAENVYGDAATVNDLHGLYSELRRVARSAMAGNDQNKNMARVANEIADAILEDLGAVGGGSTIGKAINEARAYSSALHETFDRGAVGRLLKRTLDGDTSIDPELSLKRTVGRQGTEGAVGARQLQEATGGDASGAIQDYIRDRFGKAAVSATGEFTYGSARKFLRDNAELFKLYPDLRSELDAAVLAREDAGKFAARITSRIAALQSGKSIGKAVIDGQTVRQVLSSQSPAREARKLANEARRDKSGTALAGIKASFADELISAASGIKSGQETFSGDSVLKQLADPKMRGALRQVFSSEEIGRLQRIGNAMSKVNTREAADIGPNLSGEKPAMVIEHLARIIAARQGAKAGGGSGGSIQTAQMASSRAKSVLNNLASDKASQILARAVEDPELFRSLLLRTDSLRLEDRLIPRLVPYLVGTTTATATGRETDGTK